MYTEIVAGIDTENWNFYSELEVEELKENPCLKDFYLEDKAEGQGLKVKINLNNMNGRFYRIPSYEIYEESRKGLMEVLDMEDVKRNRIDIYVDTNEEFEVAVKKNQLLALLVGYQIKTRNVFETKNLFTRKTNSFTVKSRDIDISIYDKFLESEGLHRYKTRIEFRYKRAWEDKGQEEKGLKYIKETEKYLKQCLGNLDTLEEHWAEMLYKDYQKAVKDKVNYSFSEFVRNNKRDFMTQGIFEKVYKRVGIKMVAKRWLYEFKERNSLEFMTKTEMTKYSKEIIRALKMFVKGA